MNHRWRESFTVLLLALACGTAGALDLQGHRGARGLAPENTLAAFAQALGIGVTTLELDIAITRDDVLVVKQAQALGLQVLAWTFNQPGEIARALDLGVDGIVSDRPERVRDEMRRRGLALPAATPVQP